MTETEVEAAMATIRVNPRDDAAWSVFYAHYRGQVLGMLAISGVRDRDIREELAAEVFFRFVRYCPWRNDWGSLPGPAVIGAYIRTMTENVFRAWLHDMVRLPEAAASEPITESSERALLSTDLVQKLRPVEKRFIEIYVQSGFSLTAVAAKMKISYTAAGTRLHRIRRRIREMGQNASSV